MIYFKPLIIQGLFYTYVMNKFIIISLVFVSSFRCLLFAQQHQTTSNMNIGTSIDPIKIVAHTDSNIFILGKKKNENNEWDFYVSRYSSQDKGVDFNVCLDLTKVFKGGINPNSGSFEFFQGKNNIVLLFTAVNQSNKILFGKIIGLDGNVSEAFVIDKTDYTDKNIESCEYKSFSTNKKNILVHVKRAYKSGFERDKCILLDPFLNEVWSYELPELNAKKAENIIVDVDNSNRLIYHPWEFATESYLNMDGKLVLQRVYRKVKDTILPLKVGHFTYNMKFKKDSINLFFVNPVKNDVSTKSFYYPFVMMPVIKSITSTQLLMYSMVDIDDENFRIMGKKSMYYKRFDLKNNTILLDTLVVLNEKIQQKLMHTYSPESKHPTSKYFKLYSENLTGSNLISVYEHGGNGQFLEVFASNFNLATNKLEWTCLLPRKINVYYPNIYDLVVRRFNDNTSVSFFEHKRNLPLNNVNYEFKKYKLLRKPKSKAFISYNISKDGTIFKNINQTIDNDFLFPWLKSSFSNNDHFFFSRDFFPSDFLLNRK